MAAFAEPECCRAYGLPPLECVPEGARAAVWRYEQARRRAIRDGRAGDPHALDALIAVIDRVGPEWEDAAAARVTGFTGALVRQVLALDELHAQLSADVAALEWLAGFPDRTAWCPPVLVCDLDGRPVPFPDLLVALLRPTIDVTPRIRRLVETGAD